MKKKEIYYRIKFYSSICICRDEFVKGNGARENGKSEEQRLQLYRVFGVVTVPT